MEAQQIYNHVSERYSAASKGTAAEYGHAVAKAFGYTDQELEGIPKESNLGLSCGNPLAVATIREGETVIDLGSGAGFDAFLAANKVGPTGKVIGVDMNKDMLRRANEIKLKHQKTNVDFVESQITNVSALPSDTANVIISNCVINLVPEEEKHLVFKEMHRLLKPGGRVAISDILAKKPLPERLRANMALYVGCVAGASLVEQYQQYLQEAGFAAESVFIKNDEADLNVYLETNPDGSRTAGGKGGNLCCNPRIESAPAQPAVSSSCCSNAAAAADAAAASASSSSCCGGSASTDQPCAFDEKDLADLEGEDLNDWAGSYKIYAVKM
ncbi:hypothetical protein M406DRAFT_58979 [Cryphonectria parasitica EP155]|uniref:Arsenite methyltransferase n=1 Tax=Cryphonectria parasitica (strain ATCC 38755 / EP155) TaxID=660469 RepID=A0A9P4YB34_CRYP1|nr:uncharacterized protein M406DRAFT_58979 [Cryphonectria parasitica EP155]KAF3769766.1 hypothetical protein M406DRAFT_58979 [Cryphonectria parasitica EP155]